MDSMDSVSNTDHTIHPPPAQMDPMPMTFFTSTTTPLFSNKWQPTTATQYALTCLFLILLCIIFRCILAARCNLTALLARQNRKEEEASKRLSACCGEEDGGEFAEKYGREDGGEERRERSRKGCAGAGEVAIRALLDTLLAMISYLLMLAVMTMNTGYFLSVLAGTLVGSVLLGGYTAASGH